MNIEELKLILETIETLGEGAYEFAIFYLITCIVNTVVPPLIYGLVFFLTIRTIAIQFLGIWKSAQLSHRMADMMGERIIGDWNSGEKAQVLKRLGQLLEMERNK